MPSFHTLLRYSDLGIGMLTWLFGYFACLVIPTDPLCITRTKAYNDAQSILRFYSQSQYAYYTRMRIELEAEDLGKEILKNDERK